MTSAPFKLAVAQYEIGLLKNWADYRRKIEGWVSHAVLQGAQFLLFPEYFSMELVSLFPDATRRSLPAQLVAMQDLYPDFQKLFQDMADLHHVCVVAGSFPVRMQDGSYRNRSWLFTPDGKSDYQDKLQMTRFENEVWGISSGDAIKVFDTPHGKVGICVCYDSEFPLIARRQVEQGAGLILVPSCTDMLAGYHRVRIGCQARALENQCYVAQSSTVGTAEWSAAVDINIGAGGIYTPMDVGCPDDGVLAIGELNASQWVYANISLAVMAEVRVTGQVFNHRDWDGQYKFSSQ